MCDKTTRPGQFRAWLQLLRPPNLFTVPGDPLAGAMLACGALAAAPPWSAILAGALAAVAFYMAGLLANDCFDREVDARERPDRPIPSGAVGVAPVLGAALVLTALGLLAAFRAGLWPATTGSLLALAVWFYNAMGKRHPGIAPWSMGACRTLSLLMGAAVMGPKGLMAVTVVVPALGLGLFIGLITRLARDEANPDKPRIPVLLPWLLPVVPLAATAFLYITTPSQAPGLALLLAVMSLLWTVVWVYPLRPGVPARRLQAAVGGLIRGLLFTQAAWCAMASPEGQGVALLLLVAFPVSGWLAKWFYGS